MKPDILQEREKVLEFLKVSGLGDNSIYRNAIILLLAELARLDALETGLPTPSHQRK